MSELKVIKSYVATLDANHNEMLLVSHTKENYASAKQIECYLKSEADKVIAEKDKVIAELKADYREACDRLQTANLIKDEQKKKADVLLSTLKYLVMRDLIKDCPSKKTAAEIVKEYNIW